MPKTRPLGRRRAWLYIAGALPPFGGGILSPMIPELRETFNASTSTIAWGFTGYLLPFAAFLLISGTIATRWGVARTQRAAFILYVPATLFCIIAPNFAWFMVGRVVQGAINAFMTPLLIASLTENIALSKRGRTIGLYAAFQSLGQILAPLLGGICADFDWRLAFVLVAALSALIAVNLPAGSTAPAPTAPAASDDPAAGEASVPAQEEGDGPTTGEASAPAQSARSASLNFRSLLKRPILLLGVTTALAAAGPINVIVLVSLTARDELGLSGSVTGVLLLAGTGAAMVLVQPWGRLIDSWGALRATVSALVLSGSLVAILGTLDSVLALTLVWVLTGASIQFVVVGVQSLAATADTDNRGGVISFTLSNRFFGHSLGTLIWVPVFTINPQAAFTLSALMTVLAIAAVLASGLGKQAKPPRKRHTAV